MSKMCSKCGVTKPMGEFDGAGRECSKCLIDYIELKRKRRKEACRKYYQKNKEAIAQKAKIYHQKNPEKRKLIQKKSENKNREKIRTRRKNKYIIKPGFNKEYQKAYYSREENKTRRRTRNRERYAKDVQYKLTVSLRRSFRMTLKGQSRLASVLQLIGCSIEDLKKHISSQFTNGMDWTNWGVGDKKWHIDHIIPCAAFDMTKESERKTCWHYTNLRPLWSIENLIKSDRLPDGSLARLKQSASL